jgi:HSP20 family protein
MMVNTKRKRQDWNNNKGARRASNVPVRQKQNSNNPPAYSLSYFSPLSSFFSGMDRVFNNTLRNFGVPMLSDVNNFFDAQNMFIPNIDIASNDNEYTLTVEVPGIDEKDIQLDISEDGQLYISGEKRCESRDKRRNMENIECSYGAFERTLSLPDDVDIKNVDANFRNGILTITCPRNESARSQSRQIPISGERRSAANNDRVGLERGTVQGPKRAA